MEKPTSKFTEWTRWIAFSLFCFLIFFSCQYLTEGLDESTSNESQQTTQTDTTIEYKLAAIDTMDAGGSPSEEDINIARFRYLLKELSAKTGETKKHIADATVFYRNKLRDDYGKKATLLELMDNANKALQGSNANFTYAETLALMITMIGQ